jgi:ABC-type phosphate/phosphonate transport system substrate-binding protein
MSARRPTLAALAGPLTAALLLPACGGSGGDEYVLAFKVTEDRREFVERSEPLAEWITERTGVPTRALLVQDDSAQITALTTGQADAAYMSGGPSWIAWSEFGLDAIALEQHDDGTTSYTAGLWVRADSDYETVEDLRGARSCHTGELAGTGMLVPIGYLIREGLVDAEALDPDDIGSVRKAREQFFGSAQIGGGYLGAFQCLATGQGDVATGRHTAWDDFCGGEDPEPWCEPREAFRWLPAGDDADRAIPETGGLAEVPSHPVMVSDELEPQRREALLDALLALNGSPEGREILEQVLEADGLVPGEAAEHLAPYTEILRHVPGIEAYFGGDGS